MNAAIAALVKAPVPTAVPAQPTATPTPSAEPTVTPTPSVEPTKTPAPEVKPSLTVKKAVLNLKTRKSAAIVPVLTGISGNITYKSSNKKVAAVNSKGKVTAKKTGKAVITVKCGNYKTKVTVYVNEQAEAEEVFRSDQGKRQSGYQGNLQISPVRSHTLPAIRRSPPLHPRVL